MSITKPGKLIRFTSAGPGKGSRVRQITLTDLLLFFFSLIGLCALLVWSEATNKVDRLLHDEWVRADQRPVPSDVVILAIDSDSLHELGRWPWTRQVQAEMFEQLVNYQIKVAVVDLLYTERSGSPDADQRLSQAIASLPESVLPVLTEGGGVGASIESLPIPEITRHISSLGHVFLPIDDDGIVRRLFLKAGISAAHWPSLSLAALEVLQADGVEVPGKISGPYAPSERWVTDHEVYIPFYGPNGTFPRVSAIDLIRGTVDPERLRDKIVFVGMTTTGLGDVVPTPVSALDQPVPGVEIHANAFASLRDGSMVTKLNPYYAMLITLLTLPVLFLAYSRARPEWGVICAIGGALLPIAMSNLAYTYANVWLSPLSASVPMLVSYLLWSRHRLQFVNRFLEQEQIRTADYVPRRAVSDNEAMKNFFESATRHLPITAWRFSTGRERFSGGDELLPLTMPAPLENRWGIQKNLYARRYQEAHGLLIEMRIEDDQLGPEIADYIDSLARVRMREQTSVFAGSVERLQSNVQTLSDQFDWLRNVRNFSDTMLAATPVGFAIWNPAGECIRSNNLIYDHVSNFKRRGELMDFMNGLGRESVEGEDAKRFNQLVMNCKPWEVSYREEERELMVSFRAVGRTLSQRLICVSVVDLTDIRTVEKARAEMVDYLSHDLRSPLISALYLLEPVADKRIAKNINSSLLMMDNLLHVARADSLSESQFVPLLLNSVLDNSLDQLLPQALNKSIRFQIEIDDDIDLWMVGDAASLERAFANIVGNAIKYSPEGSCITVTLTGDEEYATLMVDDEGVGIAPDMLDQLFTRFKRDPNTASEHKGIGLGLALVTRVVRLHSGTVKASNLPVGTRITLILPLEGNEEHADTLLELTQNM